jgi:hypothetical protein
MEKLEVFWGEMPTAFLLWGLFVLALLGYIVASLVL